MLVYVNINIDLVFYKNKTKNESRVFTLCILTGFSAGILAGAEVQRKKIRGREHWLSR